MFLIILQWFIVLILCLYIFSKLTCGFCKSDSCLVGKTALITGGNSGIGFQVTKMLAARGCRVIIADVENCEESKRKIIEETNNPNIVTKYVNLASFKSIRTFAEDIINTEEKIEILINNAGIGNAARIITEDGLDLVMQVNYFGPILLTHLLIGLLKKSEPSRIIFTSSTLCFVHNLTLKNIERQLPVDKYLQINSVTTYANSKLATIIACNEIARRLKGTRVTSNSLHPGLAKTDIFKKSLTKDANCYISHMIARIINIYGGKNVWEAAQTTLYLATERKLENVTGKFFMDCREWMFPSKAYNEEFCKEIFKRTEKIIGLKESEKLKY